MDIMDVACNLTEVKENKMAKKDNIDEDASVIGGQPEVEPRVEKA